MPLSRTAEAPASIPSQSDATSSSASSEASAASDAERKSFIAIMKYLKQTRDELGPRPSKSQVEAASSAVSSIVADLEKQIDTIAMTAAGGIPQENLPNQSALALRAFKEDVARTKAQMQLLPHVSVLELDKKFRHYDSAVGQAEQALLSGKWKSEHGQWDWAHALQTAEHEAASPSPHLPSSLLSLNLPPVFSTHPHYNSPHHYHEAPASNGTAPVLRATSHRSRFSNPSVPSAQQYAQEYQARTGEILDPAVAALEAPPSQGFVRAATAHGGQGRVYQDKAVVMQSFMDDHQMPYSPGAASGMRAAGFAARGPSRLQGSDALPEESEDGSVRIDPLLLRIIQDSVQNKPRSLDMRGHLFELPLEIIPETLGFIDSLTELNVSENSLVILPDSLGSLKKLQALDVSCNHLLELPRSIGELTELKELDAHHNKLEELPTTIGGCEALEVLHVEFNQLKGLPKAIGQLKSLRVFTLHLNQIVTLPMTIGQLESLVELDVHHNAVTSIPESLGRLVNLEKLNVSANHFSLQALPSSIGQLVKLRELDLRENHIKVLPMSVTMLTGLKSLKMDGNPWKQPPIQVVDQGLQAIMAYMSQNREEKGVHHAGSLKSGAMNLFRRMHKKSDEAEKLASWKSHANTWGA